MNSLGQEVIVKKFSTQKLHIQKLHDQKLHKFL